MYQCLEGHRETKELIQDIQILKGHREHNKKK